MNNEDQLKSLNDLQIAALTYSLVYLLQNEEYSVREFALLAFNSILKILKQTHVVHLIENQLIKKYLLKVKDDMIL